MTVDNFLESIKDGLLELPAIKYASGITCFKDTLPEESERIKYRRRVIINAIVRPFTINFLNTVKWHTMGVEEYNKLFIDNLSIWLDNAVSDEVF